MLDAVEFLAGFAGAKVFLEAEAIVKQHEIATRIGDRARQYAPTGSVKDPHPGRLVEDIGIKGEGVDKGMPYVDVGTTVPEGFLEEYGTSHSAAHPFMRPAIAMEK
jgi:hypothetical protein